MIKMWVKICGIKRLEDALAAAEAGADAIGFVFVPSKRQIDPQDARKISLVVPSTVAKVGVFVDESPKIVKEKADFCKLDYLQFHGNESQQYCSKFQRKIIKAFPVQNCKILLNPREYVVYLRLLDTYSQKRFGGTGQRFNCSESELINEVRELGPFVLAGGLTPENVLQNIKRFKPYGVDVSSGVETKGEKDIDKIWKFIKTAKKEDA